MNSCCREVIEPSVKLAKMVTLLKILGIVHFVIILGDLFLFGTGLFFFLLIQFLALLLGITSKHFGQYMFFILICIFNAYSCFQSVGAWFQVGFYKKDKALSFGFMVFFIIFEIFCIFVIFQVYKQAKHEYRIKMGYAPNDNDARINDNNNVEGFNDGDNFNDGNNGNNNDGGFAAFQGHGVPVGGN